MNTFDTAKMTAKDWKCLLVIMLLYGVISFIGLGSFTNPQSFWYAGTTDSENSAVFELQDTKIVHKVSIYTGSPVDILLIESSIDGEKYTTVNKFTKVNVWSWIDAGIDSEVKYLRITAYPDGSMLGEIAAWDIDGKLCDFSSHMPNHNNPSSNNCIDNLTDEQSLVPYDITYACTANFDEVYFARTAYEYVHHQEIYEYTHPPLGKLIMSIPIHFMGMVPFAYRLMGNLAGIIMLAVIYLFTKRIIKKTNAAILATLLLALDGMHFVHTRIGTVDSFLVLFTLLSFYFMYCYTDCEQNSSIKDKVRYLALSGLFLGCAIAVKWNAAYSALALACIFFNDFFTRSTAKKSTVIWEKQRIKILGWCTVFFLALPLSIYLLSYLPFLLSCEGSPLSELMALQKKMFTYHSSLPNGNDASSPFYLWPFSKDAIVYFSNIMEDGRLSEVIMFGNPLLWWSGIIAIIYILIRAVKTRAHKYTFLARTVVILYIPYLFIARDMYLYHYFSVVPIMFICLTVALHDFTAASKIKKADTNYTARQRIVIVYLAAAAGVFIFLYPIYSGLALPLHIMKPLLWIIDRMI